VLSITSHEHSRLAKLADFNLSWHVPQTRIAGVYDITTQIPVIYILESLGRKLAKKLQNKTPCFFDVTNHISELLYRDI
jgi:DNA-binding MurR/RpiR family transcriptional regulator